MKKLLTLFLFFTPGFYLFSNIHHHYVKQEDIYNNSLTWKQEGIDPFEELIISWNASRPTKGQYEIYVSINTGTWSPWFLYATWGDKFQKSTISKLENIPVQVYLDSVETLEGKIGNSFKIKIAAKNGANLSGLRSIHVCSSRPKSLTSTPFSISTTDSYELALNGLSQMALLDKQKKRLCSPTSTTAVIRFLKKEDSLDPLEFAKNVWDASSDIFGNWVLNIAEAYNQINDPSISCWAERLTNFQPILESLQSGFPVVISVQGPLLGSAQPYKYGHLLTIIGFDNKTHEVICMDPAFDKDEETKVRYNLEDLLKAWARRNNIAYIFRNTPH